MIADKDSVYSYRLRGHLPSGITGFGFNKGFGFKYRSHGEIVIIPRVVFPETPDTPRTITLTEIEDCTNYCEAYYDNISPRYNLIERIRFNEDSLREKVFPKNRIAYILRGDIAEIYVIAPPNNVLEMLSIFISGCKTESVFDTEWERIRNNLIDE